MRINTILVSACLLLAVAGYLVFGRPGLADQPMSARQAALNEKIRADPESLTYPEMLSRLEMSVREQPDSPEPHFFIGELLRTQGRGEDAVRAYQSALRRDVNFVPAMISLADVLVMNADGSIGPDATRLYARAYQLDETQVSAGMRAAMGAAQAGDQEKAEQAMRYIYARLPEDDPRRERFRPMIEAIGQGAEAETP